jgi:hypothetical protein
MTHAHQEDELWFVQISSDEVRALDLDALDEAFQAGTVDESTLVRRDGTSEWTTLGAMLAGDAPDAGPIEAATPSAPPPSAPPPPVVAELANLDDLPSFGAPKKRAAIVGALATLAVLGGVGVTAARMAGAGALADGAKVTASMPVPAPAPSLGATETLNAFDAGPRFNDEQRRLLLEADKKREAEAAARRPAHVTSSAPSRAIKLANPIRKGGSKYDPLNGQL